MLTGCRPGELFAMHGEALDRERELIYVHQTVDRYGHLIDGLKGTQHIDDYDRRGRWTLFPEPVLELLGCIAPASGGFLFPSPRGKLWAIRNFYRSVWTPAQQRTGVAFILYDLRHTFSSRLPAAGIPAIELLSVDGARHSRRRPRDHQQTTRVYAHATGEWRRAALAELAALMRGDELASGAITP